MRLEEAVILGSGIFLVFLPMQNFSLLDPAVAADTPRPFDNGGFDPFDSFTVQHREVDGN